jgi:hypothetical protein
MGRSHRAGWMVSSSIVGFAIASAVAGAAAAQTQGDASAPAGGDDASYKARIDADEKALSEQARQIAEQRAMLDEQKKEIDALKSSIDSLENVRATGRPTDSLDGPLPTAPFETVTAGDNGGGSAPAGDTGAGGASGSPSPGQPVGQAPPSQPPPAVALPTGINALTPAGHLVYEAGVDYQRSSSKLFEFEGVQILNTFLIGIIQSNTTANDAVIDWNNFRYGILPRLEAEIDVPYVYRTLQSTTNIPQTNNQASITNHLSGWGIGDVDGILRYQITSGRAGEPIVIGNMEVKSDTGLGPYGVRFNSFGVASNLPVGSGFWAVQPSLSVIYPSDPVVIFGNIGYLHSFGYDINKIVGGIPVGLVQPGDALSGTLGFSFALNTHFSYSLGFIDNYFFDTQSVLGNKKFFTSNLEAAQLLVGGSYRLTKHLTLNMNLEFGVTPDAPNTTVTIRLPYVF